MHLDASIGGNKVFLIRKVRARLLQYGLALGHSLLALALHRLRLSDTLTRATIPDSSLTIPTLADLGCFVVKFLL